VSKTSDPLDLKAGKFKQRSAHAIATLLKRAALASHRRKAEPFRSGMSMLNFRINRAGRGLTAERRRTLAPKSNCASCFVAHGGSPARPAATNHPSGEVQLYLVRVR
jgi:Protein of unknown function (DUF3175)